MSTLSSPRRGLSSGKGFALAHVQRGTGDRAVEQCLGQGLFALQPKQRGSVGVRLYLQRYPVHG
ncbi:MAG: hypothetical protein JWM61_2723 [Micrococcaceae bacterium]|jgi:hypothetical protein|nr:hypothetical protein [Micrococcaceae bacterium]